METVKRKKLLAAALTLVMVFVLALPALAASPGSITINKPGGNSISIEGQTFDVYRIFDLTMSNMSDPDDSAYSYTTATKFSAFTYTVDGTTYTGATLPAYVATLGDDSAALDAFAKAVWAWIYNEGGTARATPDGTGVVPTGAETVTISDIPLGYYLVYGAITSESKTVVAACSLTNADPAASITVKADAPTLEKQVSDSATGTFGDYTDLNIGDTAYFKLTSKVPNMKGYTSYTYTVHDTLSAGLTYDTDSLKVKINDVEIDLTDDYTLSTVSGAADTTIITINFVNFIKYKTSNVGDDIEITYSATLNEDAVVSESTTYSGNPNEVYLEYSNDPYGDGTGETPKDEVFVYTFKFDVFKYTGNISTPTALSGAEFELHKYDDTQTGNVGAAISFIGSAGSYRHALATETAPTSTTMLVSPASGTIELTGLDSGTYYLVETNAPDGYNLLTAPIEVHIVPDEQDAGEYTVQVDDKVDGENFISVSQVNVLNNTGTELPKSGGIGRTIFTVVGLLLMFGAGVALVARRKTSGR
jgi:fimbrial isopeptide formation D2 family protein/LPXTG-motif cell wall-anchored protein